MTKLAFLIAFLVALAYLLKKDEEIEPELEQWLDEELGW